ncbi:unnamed protein product [Cylicocyclus nassatus]|uniref:Tyrosine-protein kinase receptor n=1 Tax=Cylicocyclus nassatus TaxID=53992 RepID=A0AA36GFQ4_CYLNA|nr:unnamed protein product [Cylicocyclus nassatus]
MYADDNEEAANNARRQLLWFLEPCHDVPLNGTVNKTNVDITENRIRCDDMEILSGAGDAYVERHCHNEESPDQPLLLRRISYEQKECSCSIRCDDGTEFFRYAGCRCPQDEYVHPEAGCLDPDCVWKPDDSRWIIINTTGSRAAFASIALPPGNNSASIYSPYYQQISIQCVLEFAYRLNSAPHSSIVVTAEFLNPNDYDYETVHTKKFREEKDYYTRRPHLARFEAGHFFQPTRIRVECRSDSNAYPQTSDNSTMTECELGKFVWDEECTEQQPSGSKCDFNDEKVYCDGWTILTAEQSKPVNEHLLRVKRTMRNIGPTHESRPGGGSFLLYSTELNRNLSLTTRDTFLTSPFYPAIFNDDDKCKLRFHIIRAAIDVEWSMSIIHPSWVKGSLPQRVLMEEEGLRVERGWHRQSLSIGPQFFPFALQIEANWVVTSSAAGNAFVAVDDISFSVECFDKDRQLVPVHNWTSITVDSCGATGTQLIRADKCLRRGHRQGPYQYLLVDHQEQVWTVPETLHYRIVACGAEGGSFTFEPIENKGGCVTADIDLIVGTKLRLSIGQKGESPCDPFVRSSMDKETTKRLCSEHYRGDRINSSLIYGAGGGGPTTVSLDNAYIIVAAGGGGAYPLEYIEGLANNPAGGFFSSDSSADNYVTVNAGNGISISSPTQHLWSCGGFPNTGGIAAPCDPAAGGGGGYYGGAAQIRNHGIGGTNWLGVNATFYHFGSGVHSGDGVVIIWFRRLYAKVPTAADQIRLVVMQSDYKDVDVGESYWDQIASLPCLPWNEISIGREIGTGAFGTVHEGHTKDGKAFAVKTICMNKSTSAEAQREFAFEALFMHKFNHPNIVRLHWIQWDPPRLRIILELMEGGDLRSFLRDARPTQENANPFNLSILDIVNISLDIARGCEELNRQKYIHRDLAARNCLLKMGPNRRAKIGDFGMARDIYENNYYRKGGRAKLPVRWMPPEAFLDGLFTTQTDVWSFGVVLWEISSFGMLPYYGVDNFDVMGLVTNGGRLDAPNTVPLELQEVMRKCWNTKAEERPSFSEIVASLELLAQKEQLAQVPICCFGPMSPAIVSPVACSSPSIAFPSPSLPSVADTPCTVATALSPSSPDDRPGFGISMTGVPYIPINSGALREVFEERSTSEGVQNNSDLEKLMNAASCADDWDQDQATDNIDDTIAKVKQALFGSREPPTPPPRRPTTLPRLWN